jgi:hypothetical protein
MLAHPPSISPGASKVEGLFWWDVQEIPQRRNAFRFLFA